ncbi:general transcriptional corepressor trfA [Octopus sinensis]|uniref:General transcriptional corepressor trfA n=1 Tax=Octopus sinensis TaxID=2607531 RepID=A0A6P7TTH4_9MOLL|nr:general transcriptional corepressor trfA [Octopus sinensis]
MMSQITSFIGILCCLFFLPTVLPVSIYNMDEPSTCDQTVKVYETPIIVNARKSTVTPSNPRQYCDLYLEASSTDNAYRLQIIIKSVAIKDSAFRLRIIDGTRNGNLLRQLGHGSKTTDMIVTKSSTAVLSLYRPKTQYYTENDFSLEIKGYRDPDEPEAVFGGSRLAPGAIIGIVIAVLLLIAFAFALCYMYNTGILTGKRRRHNRSKSLTKVPLGTNGSMASVVTAGSESVLGQEKTNAQIRSDGGGHVNRAYNTLVLNSMLATSQGKGRSDGEGNVKLGRSISRGSSINIADRPALTPPHTTGKQYNKYHSSDEQEPDAEYLEPVSHRRSGRLNTVTFDTKPSHFERSFNGGLSQQQQSPHGSHRGSGSRSQARPNTDRHSGRSATSYNEIQQLPDLFVNDPESKAQHSQKSRSPRDSSRDQSPKRRTPSYRYNPSTDNNKNVTEPAEKTGVQQHDDGPLSEMNKNSKHRSSHNQSPTTNGPQADNVAYAQIRHKAPSAESRDRNSTAENKISEDKVPSRGNNINRVSITEEELQEEIQKRQEQKQEREKHQSKNGSNRGRSREREDGRRYGEDEEDEDDLEVKHFHTLAENGNSTSIGNSFDFETGDEEPRQMTNPVVNNTYIKKSMQDPMMTATEKSQTKPSGRRDSHSQFQADEDDDDIHSRPVHPHFGIPDLVQNSSHQDQSDPYYSGFPTAFSEIMSRTVNPNPNKSFAYGYHSHSDPHREDSVSGKAAWYMESTPTKSGPINTTAFFMQTSQPSQRNEDSPQHTNTPPSAFRTVNGMGGNRLPPEYTSTPADPYAPAASSSPKSGHGQRGEVVKPKPRSRKSLPNRSGSPPRRFPLSVPDPHAIDGISAIEPGQRSAMVRSGFDPTTGCQTSQVMWAEKVPDPTDPGPSDNPSITRKTINRITTRSTYDRLPDNPFPLLAQMHADPSEPSFLSPSANFQGGIGLLPRPEEISFYTQNGGGTAAPVIHEAPNRNQYIKDKISYA